MTSTQVNIRLIQNHTALLLKNKSQEPQKEACFVHLGE